MRKISIEDINMGQISAFLSVAKNLNMTKSANELCLTQSAVSQRIASLEQSFGLILFIRNKNILQLTPAGKQLYKDLITAYSQIESAFINAHKIQTGKRMRLTIGIDAFFDWEILYKALERFKNRYEFIDIDVAQIKSYESIEQTLIWKEMDLSITVQDYIVNSDIISSRPLLPIQFFALINKTNPLAQKEDICIQDILSEPILIPIGQCEKHYYEIIEKLYTTYGKRPVISNISGNSDGYFIMNVILNKGIALGSPGFWQKYNKRLSDYASEYIKTIKIEGAAMALCFAWLKDNKNQYISIFLDILNEVLEESDNRQILYEGYNGKL